MALVTTHSEGRVVTHSTDDAGPIEVVQLPNRDAAAASPESPTSTATEGRLDDVERQVDGSLDPPSAGAAMRVKPRARKPASTAKAPAKKR